MFYIFFWALTFSILMSTNILLSRQIYKLDHKEGLMLRNRCFWIVVLEKTLESPFYSKETKQSVLREIEKAREFQKNIYFCFIDYANASDCVDHNKLWKILQEMGIPDHLICLLRNLYSGQDAIVRTGHGTTYCLKIAKGVSQALSRHDAYLTYIQSTSYEMPDWMNPKLESRD